MSKPNRAASASQRRQRPRPASRAAPDVSAASDAGEDGATPAQPQPAPPADPRLMRLRQLYDVVADAGAALNISPTRLAEGEALDRLEVVARFPVEQLARCDGARAQGWFAMLRDDLALDLRLDGQDPDMPDVAATLRAGADPAGALQAFQARAQSAAESQGDAVNVEARLSAGKARALALARELVADRPGVAAPAMVAVFYTAAAWNRLLTLAGVPYLEQSGLVRGDGRTCVVICDSVGYLAGAALECVGAASPATPDWLPVTPSAFRRFVAREAASRRLLTEESGWPDAPRILTTERLRLVERAPGMTATAARLAILRMELAAASLASVVQGTLSDGLTLHFAGTRPATCRLPGEGDTEDAGGEALARLADWATRHGTVDTLIIARECLARELPPGRAVSLAEVARAAVDALEAAKANFTLFVRGQTDRYFAARQSAQDAVAEYAETVRKGVSDLTSDVVDNVYRTVGLLAAVVIAGLIQPAISPWLALAASILYSGYIVFVILFLLRARSDHFTLEQAALTTRLAAMSELTTAERERIREPAMSADAYYQRYVARARVIYRALLAAGVICALVFLVVALAHR
ncbi:MAG TPA: hypothetical protein VFQ32_01010 [Ktedonobacterales bacterium]|nr:hypothetical protein [Ktedonobacterales bacterium]